MKEVSMFETHDHFPNSPHCEFHWRLDWQHLRSKLIEFYIHRVEICDTDLPREARIVPSSSNIHRQKACYWVRKSKTCLAFGKPQPCAPITVISPGPGLGLSIGVYCLSTSFSLASELTVASGYSRTCCPSITCSFTVNGNVEVAIVFALKYLVQVNLKRCHRVSLLYI